MSKDTMTLTYDEVSLGHYVMHQRGEFGQIISNHDKQQHPYSYGPFTMWGKKDEKTHREYDDRLRQRDHVKYEKCLKNVFGKHVGYFNYLDPKLIEKFLCEYFEKPIKLVHIEECCNISNGYPYWAFDFIDIKEKKNVRTKKRKTRQV